MRRQKNRMSRQKKNPIKGSIKRRIEPLLYVFLYTMQEKSYFNIEI